MRRLVRAVHAHLGQRGGGLAVGDRSEGVVAAVHAAPRANTLTACLGSGASAASRARTAQQVGGGLAPVARAGAQVGSG
jgi:hypothetical protein